MSKIDEKTLKDAVARGIPPTGGYVPPSYLPPEEVDEDDDMEPEEPKSRRRGADSAMEEYRKHYFAKTDHSARQLLYVSEELHESLTRIVNDVGGKRATIASYVENIIRTHLSEHKELLNGTHKRKYKCLIGW